MNLKIYSFQKDSSFKFDFYKIIKEEQQNVVQRTLGWVKEGGFKSNDVTFMTI